MTRIQLDPIHDRLVAHLDDSAYAQALRQVLQVCRENEIAALRWQDQLPVPSWIPAIRYEIAAALGLELEDMNP